MSNFFTLFHIFPNRFPGPSLLSGFAERRDLFQEATPSSFSIRIQIGLFRWELEIKEDPTASFFRESRQKKDIETFLAMLREKRDQTIIDYQKKNRNI